MTILSNERWELKALSEKIKEIEEMGMDSIEEGESKSILVLGPKMFGPIWPCSCWGLLVEDCPSSEKTLVG